MDLSGNIPRMESQNCCVKLTIHFLRHSCSLIRVAYRARRSTNQERDVTPILEAFIFFNIDGVRRIAGLDGVSHVLVELLGSQQRAN